MPMSRAQALRLRREEMKDWAGYRERRLNPRRDGYYVLLEAREAGIEVGGPSPAGTERVRVGRWALLCDTHNCTVLVGTYALARFHLPAGDWCEECMALDAAAVPGNCAAFVTLRTSGRQGRRAQA